MTKLHPAILAIAVAIVASPALAQDAPAEQRRTRVGLGPQLEPSYPGARGTSLRPLVEFSRARGTTEFDFEAADESFGFPVFRSGGFAAGPALGFEGKRESRDVGTILPSVGATFEAGGFVQYALRPEFRVRLEGRKGIGGHRGLVGVVSADYIARRGDDYLFAIGPRVTLSDGRYQRAYFGVAPGDAAAAGLPAFRPGGGVQAVGAAVNFLRQLTPRWGIYSYAKYDRLVDDAGRSPIVRRYGSRDQYSGGIALTHSFGPVRD